MTTRSEAALETGSQALIYDLCPLFREALADVVRTMPAFRGCVTVSTARRCSRFLTQKALILP